MRLLVSICGRQSVTHPRSRSVSPCHRAAGGTALCWPCPGDRQRETPALWALRNGDCPSLPGFKQKPSSRPASPPPPRLSAGRNSSRTRRCRPSAPGADPAQEEREVSPRRAGGASPRSDTGTPPTSPTDRGALRGAGARSLLPGAPRRGGCRQHASAPPRPAHRTQTSAGTEETPLHPGTAPRAAPGPRPNPRAWLRCPLPSPSPQTSRRRGSWPRCPARVWSRP